MMLPWRKTGVKGNENNLTIAYARISPFLNARINTVLVSRSIWIRKSMSYHTLEESGWDFDINENTTFSLLFCLSPL